MADLLDYAWFAAIIAALLFYLFMVVRYLWGRPPKVEYRPLRGTRYFDPKFGVEVEDGTEGHQARRSRRR